MRAEPVSNTVSYLQHVYEINGNSNKHDFDDNELLVVASQQYEKSLTSDCSVVDIVLSMAEFLDNELTQEDLITCLHHCLRKGDIVSAP